MHNRQAEIAQALQVVPPFANQTAMDAEIERRIRFIAETLKNSGLKTLVLGISGGVDSTLAGRLAQLAVERLRAETKDHHYRFIAVRLPYQTQKDEADAQAALRFIAADEETTVNIAAAVQGLCAEIPRIAELAPAKADFVRGNVKARVRMVAQFTIANATAGLVIGTDHAAEAVMGFFTKFGDGACDLAPLTGLVKGQVRAIAYHLGAPEAVAYKIPTADLEELNPLKPDEDAYGVTYEEIDAFLHQQPISDAAYERITRTYDSSTHKRALPIAP
ncbi:Glutamine-dependent NAD+ synthetase [gamma proteobacterium HdN1]|nr:Glutamine-dependent NAD+ synthetase [gamma proteobacterium HdN1]